MQQGVVSARSFRLTLSLAWNRPTEVNCPVGVPAAQRFGSIDLHLERLL
jgi:hypothetical protein